MRRTVGFLNLTLYANPQILNNATIGGNQGCGTKRITAVPGWDPVTALGTANSRLCWIFSGVALKFQMFFFCETWGGKGML